MQGPSHLLVSWYFADACRLETPRERRIVAWSGFAPDVDVLAYAAAIVWYGFDKDRAFENVWSVVHHRYTHGLSFVVLTAIVAWFLANRRTAVLAAAASALHCFLDIVLGGPTWPIYPLWPLSDLGWTASWSFTLADWPNHLILFGCLAGMFAYARRAGRTPMEVFGTAAERWFVGVARGRQREARAGPGRVRALIWLAVVLVALAILAPLGFNPGG